MVEMTTEDSKGVVYREYTVTVRDGGNRDVILVTPELWVAIECVERMDLKRGLLVSIEVSDSGVRKPRLDIVVS